MTARILSQHGNVIAADFRPRTELTVELGCKIETLFCDERITLIRITVIFEGKPFGEPQHILADLATSQIATL